MNFQINPIGLVNAMIIGHGHGHSLGIWVSQTQIKWRSLRQRSHLYKLGTDEKEQEQEKWRILVVGSMFTALGVFLLGATNVSSGSYFPISPLSSYFLGYFLFP